MITVSTIVSAYYAEQYLEGRLVNLLAQSNENVRVEIIVIAQAGSKEAEITTEHMKGEDDRITLKTTEGVPTIYEAWNIGIGLANGKYITNANCDDRLYPHAILRMASALEERPDHALCYADVEIVDEIGGEPIGRYKWAEGGFDELLKGCFCGPMPVWRKSLHEKHGLFDAELQVTGDYEFWLRITKAGEKLFHYREVLGEYLKRKDGQNLEHRAKIRTLWENRRTVAKYKEKAWQQKQ